MGRKKKPKPEPKPEEPVIVEESPEEESPETEIAIPEEPAVDETFVVEEDYTVESVIEQIAEGMVKIEVIRGSVGILGYDTLEQGETAVIPKTVAEKIDPRFIKIV